MNYVVDNGPWMVCNKPLVVQKWDISMNIERTEPDKLPLWVRLCNPPLEALTVKGISALASRIGKPLIMDARTTSMCKLDVGNWEVTGHKTVKVLYDWIPHVCSECGVFGHNVRMCPKSVEDGKINQANVASKVISSDFNVTLYPSEHSAGSSFVSNDMMEFKDCISQVEVEDLSSAGLHYTWTKNLHKVKLGDYSGILKKLDRVLINEDFISKFPQAHAIFMPYLIYDHSPALLIIPNGMKRKKKSFKFANYITEKEDFGKIVEESNGNLVEKVQALKNELKSIQAAIDADPYDKSLREKGSAIMSSFMEAVKDEKLLYQKCKIKWLSYGDKNNTFFHKMLKGRYQKNKIQAIHDINGRRFDGDQVANQFVNHFKNFLGINVPVTPIANCESIFTKKLSEREACLMIRPITDREIKAAMFSMDDNKAPGPDGRLIQDNILLAQDLMQGYNRVGGPKRVAFKIDIQKEYDTVNWDFMDSLLDHFGFHEKMRKWIMICIRTVKFSININGESCGFFKGGRGLRQGDPMSLYLLTMVMEFFTLVMEKNVRITPDFNYHFGCKHLKITHICFADDLLVFCHGDHCSMKLIKDSIDEFGKCSGLLPNFSKSSLFW
nr:hypothetical protein [Tanacetum cinerariifolium]